MGVSTILWAKATFFVTHNKEIVNQMEKRVVTLKKGVIISDEEKGAYIDED